MTFFRHKLNKEIKDKILYSFSLTVFILVILTIPYELFFRRSFGNWPLWLILCLFALVFVVGLIAILVVVGFQRYNPYCPDHFVDDACELLFVILYSLEVLGLIGYWFGDSTSFEGALGLYSILGALLGTHIVYKKNPIQSPKYKKNSITKQPK